MLNDFGRKTLHDRYMKDEDITEEAVFARVAVAYGDNDVHADRLFQYMCKLWFMPSTPILINAGSTKGMPISCFLNSVDDNLESIIGNWTENAWLSARGGGLGINYSNVRSIGEDIDRAGHTSGIIPFIHVIDALALGISQGSARRGSAAVYLNVWHPEIEEFLAIRKTSGDFNRKALNLHHGINVDNKFMDAVRDGLSYDLISPKTKRVTKTVDARELWQQILDTRLSTGEPYLLFIDTVNEARPEHHKILKLKVQQSNLCNEIVLPTGKDHHGRTRTAVCCLSSVNLATFEQWHHDDLFIEDVMRMLDNVLTSFIDNAPPEMKNAVYSAIHERSVGLGVMGFHTLLQSKGVAFDSVAAQGWNDLVFRHIRKDADAANVALAHERGSCPDAQEVGDAHRRFSHMMAIAPTASISIIAGVSASIEPIPANVYTHKTLSGSFVVRNEELQRVISTKYAEHDSEELWDSILANNGSVQHIEWLSEQEKAVFQTAFEIDQRAIISLAGNRQKYIDQSQSVNLFLPSDISKFDLHMIHYAAWVHGLKGLYYCRSRSLKSAEHAGRTEATSTHIHKPTLNRNDFEECSLCQ